MSSQNSMNPLRYPLDPYLIALYILGGAGPFLINEGQYIYREAHFVDSIPAVAFGAILVVVGVSFLIIAIVGIVHKVVSDAIANGVSRGQKT